MPSSHRPLAWLGCVTLVVTTAGLATKLDAPQTPTHGGRGAAAITATTAHRDGASARGDAPTAETTCGTVRGVTSDGVDAFYGVRYATVAERWTPPVPLPEAGTCWNGTFDASSDSTKCVGIFGEGQESDCQTLNVLAPTGSAGSADQDGHSQSQSQSQLPVMVFFHGGGQSRGT